MRKKIYLAIIERLRAAAPAVRHISLWNENITDLERESGYGLPAVFVEFTPIRWEGRGAGTKSAPLTLRLHIVTQTLADPADGAQFQEDALGHFDLIDEVVLAASGLAGEGFGRLQHTETVPDHNHDQIQHDVEVFRCEVRDFAPAGGKTTAMVGDVHVSAR